MGSGDAYIPGYAHIKRDQSIIAVLFSLLLMLGCSMGVGLMAAPGADFVSGFEDLPLPPGMTNLPGSQTVFDSQEGRIIDATATGQADDRLTIEMVQTFYRQTLPQLGWQVYVPGDLAAQDLIEDRFGRANEILIIVLQRIGTVIYARFTLTPAP